MSEFNYQRYLASREWALLKERVKERDGNTCELCFAAPHENTHHLTYERLGHEDLSDLMGVCRPCHEWLSGKRESAPLDDLLFVVSNRLDVSAVPGRDMARALYNGEIAAWQSAIHLLVPYAVGPDGVRRGPRVVSCLGPSCPFCAQVDELWPLFFENLLVGDA